MTATAKKPGFSDYIVKDIALADFGRKEISLAETELVCCRWRPVRNMVLNNL